MRIFSNLEKAKEYYYKSNFQEAILELEGKVESAWNNEDKANIYLWLGDCYIGLKKYNEGIEFYDKALDLTPDNVRAYHNRGIAYHYLKDYRKAVENYDKVINLSPDDAEAYCNRGVSYEEDGEYHKAIDDFNKALMLSPIDAIAYTNRGKVYQKLKEYNIAISDYNKAIELNPNLTEAYNNRGNIYQELNEYQKAISDLDKVIELDPNLSEGYNNRGNVYVKLQNYIMAISDYTKAIDINPTYIEARYNRGLSYYQLDNLDKAEKDVEKALEIDQNYANAKNLEELIKLKRKQKEFSELSHKTKELQQSLNALTQNYTAQGLAKIYNNQGLIRIITAYILIAFELLIFAWIIYSSFDFLSSDFKTSIEAKNIKIIMDFMNAETFTEKMIFLVCLKITFFVPIIFLILSIRSTANNLRIRGELDGDTAVQWRFYDKVEKELKELKNTEGENSEYYKETYKAFLDTHISLRSKTNTELMQDIFHKQPKEKTIGLKQISEGLDVIEKAKNIVTSNKDDDGKASPQSASNSPAK